MARKLRIAASLCFAAVAVTLLLLSVRSYWRFNLIRFSDNDSIAWVDGYWLVNDVYNLNTNAPIDQSGVVTRNFAGAALQTWSGSSQALYQVGVGRRISTWPYIGLAAALSAAPWLRRRFSLRTLLITTTIVAVALGIGIWLAS